MYTIVFPVHHSEMLPEICFAIDSNSEVWFNVTAFIPIIQFFLILIVNPSMIQKIADNNFRFAADMVPVGCFMNSFCVMSIHPQIKSYLLMQFSAEIIFMQNIQKIV